MSYLEEYLKVRRNGWPYEGRYQLVQFKENGFVAKIDGGVAGFVWADDITDAEVNMRMQLKQEYATSVGER